MIDTDDELPPPVVKAWSPATPVKAQLPPGPRNQAPAVKAKPLAPPKPAAATDAGVKSGDTGKSTDDAGEKSGKPGLVGRLDEKHDKTIACYSSWRKTFTSELWGSDHKSKAAMWLQYMNRGMTQTNATAALKHDGEPPDVADSEGGKPAKPMRQKRPHSDADKKAATERAVAFAETTSVKPNDGEKWNAFCKRRLSELTKVWPEGHTAYMKVCSIEYKRAKTE